MYKYQHMHKYQYMTVFTFTTRVIYIGVRACARV